MLVEACQGRSDERVKSLVLTLKFCFRAHGLIRGTADPLGEKLRSPMMIAFA
jgi:hypothetical protein